MRTHDRVILTCNVIMLILVMWLQWLRMADQAFARECFRDWQVKWDCQDSSAHGIHEYLLNSVGYLMIADRSWRHLAQDFPPDGLPKIEGQRYDNPDGTTHWIYTAGQWHRIIDPSQPDDPTQ